MSRRPSPSSAGINPADPTTVADTANDDTVDDDTVNDGSPVEDNPEMQGEGNRTAARRHRAGVKKFVDSGKVEPAARSAAPTSPQEDSELKAAEQAGLSHARK